MVENVTESWEIKQAVYEQLNKVCAKDCILGGQHIGDFNHPGCCTSGTPRAGCRDSFHESGAAQAYG
ncbi:3-hydroxyacyl-CoA dehydrogenase NAD-binding domain-containing protein [Paenibacillus rhizoplanae]